LYSFFNFLIQKGGFMLRKSVVFLVVFVVALVYLGCENLNSPNQLESIDIAPIAGELAKSFDLPVGAILQSASFHVFVNIPSNQTIYVHRITADWMESTVTWDNFNNSYDPTVLTSFTADLTGYYYVDVTGLVQDWLDGTYDNYGILLRQSSEIITGYHSSEYLARPDQWPKLVVSYMINGNLEEKTIQRGVYGNVYDSYINQAFPMTNYGSDASLATRFLNDLSKQSLFLFEIPDVPTNPGTGTPGYWMNHPDAWPLDEITIGGVIYSKTDAIGFMKDPVKGDKTYTMFPALVATKLNLLIGNDPECVEETVTEADNWMAMYPVGSGVTGNSDAWKDGEPLYWMLDEYNNGLLCAPSRD
jgi:hypothetical protein